MSDTGCACILLFKSPKTDMVAVFGETTGYYALQCMMNRMSQDPTGRKILKYTQSKYTPYMQYTIL